MDDHTTIADLRTAVQEFVSERQWESFHNPKNLSGSIAIEAAELIEIFQWLTTEECSQTAHHPSIHRHTREELADVVIYCLALANALEIDLSQAIYEKMAANAAKYPVETSRGRL